MLVRLVVAALALLLAVPSWAQSSMGPWLGGRLVLDIDPTIFEVTGIGPRAVYQPASTPGASAYNSTLTGPRFISTRRSPAGSRTR